MKGKIDLNGQLSIERAGVMKEQFCPFSVTEGEYNVCSDDCPHFGEPYEPNKFREEAPQVYVIEICHGKKLFFNELIDERGEK